MIDREGADDLALGSIEALRQVSELGLPGRHGRRPHGGAEASAAMAKPPEGGFR
jgi:hypothetical protein